VRSLPHFDDSLPRFYRAAHGARGERHTMSHLTNTEHDDYSPHCCNCAAWPATHRCKAQTYHGPCHAALCTNCADQQTYPTETLCPYHRRRFEARREGI